LNFTVNLIGFYGKNFFKEFSNNLQNLRNSLLTLIIR